MVSRRTLPCLSLNIACIGIIGIVVVVLTTGCSHGDSANTAVQAIPVAITEAKVVQVPFSLETVGQAEGSREVEVRARVGGILVKRLYEEGSTVKAGQPLFEIDKAPYEIALAQAKGQLNEQKARVEQASRESARLKGLLDQRAISQKEYDDATSNTAIAAAGLQAAEAALHQAELNLTYATVTAPISGLSGRAEHSEGALVSTGTDSLLTTVVQASPVWIRFGVADRDLAILRGEGSNPGGKAGDKPGGTRRPISKVEALMQDGSAYPRTGRINFESAVVDRQLGTMTLRAEFDNPDGMLVPGQFVRIRLLAGARNAVLVPQTAALQADGGILVYFVSSDGTAHSRTLKTEGWSGANWIVPSGIEPGEKIIVDNLLKIKPGTQVKIVAPGASDTASTTKS